MTLRWIPLASLVPHPENCNRMPPELLEKLKRNIQRTGLYEPLVVRPLPQDGAPDAAHVPRGGAGRRARCGRSAPPRRAAGSGPVRYQILNGHHRAEVLRRLGHTHARCDVWQVGDDEAWLLLATLNRLEGRDDPAARGRLLARLAEARPAEDLARLLPDPAGAIERLRRLAEPPPAPLLPDDARPEHRPMTFFLTEEQHALVSEALALAGGAPARSAPPAAGTRADERPTPPGGPPSRAERLERLALWFLESRGRR